MNAIIYFMSTKVSFNLREPKSKNPTNIHLVCRVNGKQIKINIGTQYNVLPEHWDKVTQTAIINNSLEKIYSEHNTEINKRIKECRKLFDEWKTYIAENTNLLYDSETLLRRYITGLSDSLNSNPIEWFHYFNNNISTAKDTTKRKYKFDIQSFQKFIEEKKIKLHSFDSLTYEVLKEYEKYLTDKKLKASTIRDKTTALLMLLNNAENYNLIDLTKNRINKYKKLENKAKEDNHVYLTEEEIQSIYNLELSGKKKVVRDIFITQYYLGQRISDMTLETAIIKENEIELIQQKTNERVTVPLFNNIVKDILAEYNNSFPTKIVSSRTTMNKVIKEVAKEAGINEILNYKEQIGNKIEISKKEKWELITTHTARHSFSTNMLLRGYSGEIIKKITGHRTDSAFQTYNNITSKDATRYVLKKEQADREKEIQETVKERIDVNDKIEQIQLDKELIVGKLTYIFSKELDTYKNSDELKNNIDIAIDVLITMIIDEEIDDQTALRILENGFKMNTSYSNGMGMHYIMKKEPKRKQTNNN